MKSYGIDVRVEKNRPIRAVAAGTVFYAGDLPGFGTSIIISHGDDYATVYGNVKARVAAQQTVTAGQVVGESAGVDYHFELRHGEQALNPLAWLRSPSGP